MKDNKIPSPLVSLLPVFVLLSLIHTDAADDLLCVDLGGRRIIKKKIQPVDNTTTYRCIQTMIL